MKLYLYVYQYQWSVGCVWIWCGGSNEDYITYEIYGIASLLGVAVCTMSITGFSLIGCLIGDNIGNML